MNAATVSDRKFTKQEYFDLLINSDFKFEFDNGDVTMMAGGKRAHNLAQQNFLFALNANKGECMVRTSEVAVHVDKLNKYYFPDISALCGDEEYTDEGGIERLLNPQLLVEVLSKGTEKKDRGEKFSAYKTLDSFKEYILVDSRKSLVETYYRESNGLWRIGNYYRLDQSVEVLTLRVTIPMETIYKGVELEDE